ncbi:MAG: glycosyltransferase [Planctomycetota bacterium]
MNVKEGERIRVYHVADKFGVKGSSIHGVSRLFTWWLPRYERRFDVRLIGLRKGDPAVGTIRDAGINVVSLARTKFDPRGLGDLITLFRRFRPHIAHLHGYAAANFGRIAARAVGAKIVVHEHIVDPGMPGYQVVLDWLLAHLTDAAVAVSRSTRRFMIEKRKMAPRLVKVIYNGAPLSEFRPADPAQVAAERESWGIPADCRVIGTVGRIDEQKGIRYLIEASPRVLARFPQTRFVVVGDGPLLDTLKEQARALGVAESYVFTGYSSNIPRLQSTFDIQAFPSLWEGTPLTLFEAMAMARPIVSTDVDGLGEVLRDGENALVVGPKEPAVFADRLCDLLGDPEAARRLAVRAKKESVEFDISTTVRNLERVYDTVLAT